MKIVSNATPLIALARINQLNLLTDLFGTLIIPPGVYTEVVTQAPHQRGAKLVKQATWIEVKPIIDKSKVAYLRVDLDFGEAETLVLAEEIGADWVLLDEQKARLAGQLIGLKIIGTVGLLLLAKKAGKITQVRPLLDSLKANDFHLSQQVYQLVIRQAGES